MREAKSHDELLENRVWCILYQLGYSVMNEGRNFEIEITKGEKPATKQVDVFAKDDETVIVPECKACEEMRDRDLRKDIAELASLQKGHFHSNSLGPSHAQCREANRSTYRSSHRLRQQSLYPVCFGDADLD